MSTKTLIAKSTALVALTLAVVGGSLAASPAEAGYKKHHHHGLRLIIGAPLVYGGYGYHSYRSCYWLKQKAFATDSKYWWKRYYDCKNDD